MAAGASHSGALELAGAWGGQGTGEDTLPPAFLAALPLHVT